MCLHGASGSRHGAVAGNMSVVTCVGGVSRGAQCDVTDTLPRLSPFSIVLPFSLLLERILVGTQESSLAMPPADPIVYTRTGWESWSAQCWQWSTARSGRCGRLKTDCAIAGTQYSAFQTLSFPRCFPSSALKRCFGACNCQLFPSYTQRDSETCFSQVDTATLSGILAHYPTA